MRITLGVTGGIAAYKSAELVRRLQDERPASSSLPSRSPRSVANASSQICFRTSQVRPAAWSPRSTTLR
jgi:phosphopantothenoylcysteine synthetase/decarboxylase